MADNQVEIEVIARDLASKAFDAIKEKLTSIGSVNGLVAAGVVTVAASVVTGLNKAKDAAYAYDQQVKTFMASTGLSAEAASRLIQTADDAGISFDKLANAMKAAQKNGITPSIESLAKLSDEYITLNPGVDRAQFLMDKFGRSGLDMARFMELGGTQLLKMNREVEKNLVLTQKNIEESERYRQNVDKLNDSWQGWKVVVGNEILPALSDSIEYQTELNRILKENRGITQTAAMEMAAHNVEQRKHNELINEASAANSKQALTLKEMESAAQDAADALKKASDVNKEFIGVVERMQSESESFGEQYRKIADDAKLSDEERKQKLMELEAEHEKATRQIVLNLLEQRLAQDGLTDSELKFLLEKGQAWGIYSDTVVKEAQDAINEVNQLTQSINGIPTEKTVTVTLQAQTTENFRSLVGNLSAANPNKSYYLGQGRASGGPVNSGTPYMVGERGPEIFVPQQSGTIVPNHEIKTANTVNMYITVSGNDTPENMAYRLGPAVKRILRAEGLA